MTMKMRGFHNLADCSTLNRAIFQTVGGACREPQHEAGETVFVQGPMNKRMIEPGELGRPVLQVPGTAERAAMHREGERCWTSDVCPDRRVWVYCKRFGFWVWKLIGARDGERIEES